MPPTASLAAAGTDMLDRDAMDLDRGNIERGQSTLAHQPHASQHQGQGAAQGSSVIPSPPAEVEATLSKLTSHANVTGVLVLSRPEALVIRSGGAYFEPSGPGARDRAMRLKSVVEMVRNAVVGLERDIPKSEEGDELTFLRIRTKKYEMMVSPSEKYVLVVLQVSQTGERRSVKTSRGCSYHLPITIGPYSGALKRYSDRCSVRKIYPQVSEAKDKCKQGGRGGEEEVANVYEGKMSVVQGL